MGLLSSAYSYTCASNSGGSTQVYFANKEDVTSMTLASDEWSAITMGASKVFYEYDVLIDTLEMAENMTRSDNGAYSIEHMINGYMPNMSTTSRNALQSLIDASPCGLIAIVKDNNGNQWVIGYSESFTTKRAAYVETMETSTGVAITDNNGTQFQIKSTDTEKARIFTGTVPV